MKTATPTKPSESARSNTNGSRRSTKRTDSSSKDDTEASAKKVKEGVKEIADDAKAKIQDSATAVATAAKEKVAEAKSTMTELAESSKQSAEQHYEKTVASVRRKPIGALGIAAGAGLLLGFAVASMISSRRS